MLQTILPITVGTLHARVLQRVNKRLARQMRALVRIVDIRFLDRCAALDFVGACPPSCPFSCSGAFVCCFTAVIQAECALAGAAAEGEEVELAAELELAVTADGFEVFVG